MLVFLCVVFLEEMFRFQQSFRGFTLRRRVSKQIAGVFFFFLLFEDGEWVALFILFRQQQLAYTRGEKRAVCLRR